VEVGWTGLSEPMEAQPVQINLEKTRLRSGKALPSTSGAEAESPKSTYSQVPKRVAPIYDGSQLLVFGLFSSELPSAATITAQSPDGPLSIKIQVSIRPPYSNFR